MKLLYGIGVTLVGIGIVSFVFAAIALVTIYNGGNHTGNWIAFAVLLSAGVASLLFGIRWVRTAEDASRRESTETINQKASLTFRQRFATFDLGKMNRWEWLLFLGTLAFLGLEIATLVAVFGDGIPRRALRPIAVPMCILAVAFFVLGKRVLGAIGFSIWRE